MGVLLVQIISGVWDFSKSPGNLSRYEVTCLGSIFFASWAGMPSLWPIESPAAYHRYFTIISLVTSTRTSHITLNSPSNYPFSVGLMFRYLFLLTFPFLLHPIPPITITINCISFSTLLCRYRASIKYIRLSGSKGGRISPPTLPESKSQERISTCAWPS